MKTELTLHSRVIKSGQSNPSYSKFVWDGGPGLRPIMMLRHHGSIGAETNSFDEAQARELFNWLGVMLHTGGR